MTTRCIADLLTGKQSDLDLADDIAVQALNKTVTLLKAAVPFMLPVCIVTGHLAPLEIANESAEEPYTPILLAWFECFATNPKWEIDDLTDFISMLRNGVSYRVERFLAQRQSRGPLSRRKVAKTECDLCDEVMIQWLSVPGFVRLFELAFRWDIRSLSNDKPDVLDELGLTEETMFDLPESEFVRLRLVERLQAENEQYLAEFWTFLHNDLEGIKIEQIVFDVTNAYAAANGETLTNNGA